MLSESSISETIKFLPSMSIERGKMVALNARKIKSFVSMFVLNLKTAIYFLLAPLILITAGVLFFIYILTFLVFYPFIRYIQNFRHSPSHNADEKISVTTKDGLKLIIHVYIPKNEASSIPVLFQHGIAVNRRSIDLDEHLSLAVYLKNNGYHVYVPDLRGKGESEKKPDMNYSFDDLVRFDAPALITGTLKHAKQKKLIWIGHSLGGMMGYIVSSDKMLSKKIAGMASLAGPGKADPERTPFLAAVFERYSLLRHINIRFAAELMSPFAGRFDFTPERYIYSRKNLSRKTVQMLWLFAVENSSSLLFAQLHSWIQSGKSLSMNKKINYDESFSRIKCPALFIAGGKDSIAPADSILHACSAVKSRNKRFVLASIREGFSSDYCHMGLVVGDRARLEIFPVVLDWLKETVNKRIK